MSFTIIIVVVLVSDIIVGRHVLSRDTSCFCFQYFIPIKPFGLGLHEGGYLGCEAAEVAKKGAFLKYLSFLELC